MCPLPDESVPGKVNMTDQNLINQIDSAFDGLIENVVTVYNNGNFFSNREISPFVREYLYKKISNSTADTLVVECLPQFITEDRIVHANQFLNGKKIMVAIGLQSWNDEIREVAINSTCTKKSFLNAVEVLHKYGHDVQVFLMFKPPFVSAKESISDVVEGINHLNELKVGSIIISPMRVAKNTMVDQMYRKGKYIPPTLDSLLDLIQKVNSSTDDRNVRIAISILTAKDGIESVRIQSDDEVIEAVKYYNNTHSVEKILKINTHLMPDVQFVGTIKERVDNYIKQ
jgi:radical SAM enzyme (TIGR01210 family)